MKEKYESAVILCIKGRRLLLSTLKLNFWKYCEIGNFSVCWNSSRSGAICL